MSQTAPAFTWSEEREQYLGPEQRAQLEAKKAQEAENQENQAVGCVWGVCTIYMYMCMHVCVCVYCVYLCACAWLRVIRGLGLRYHVSKGCFFKLINTTCTCTTQAGA